MNRVALIPMLLALACVGCLHSPKNYPGGGGDNINPSDYAAKTCPNLSGSYETLGELLDGDATARRLSKSMRIEYVFPFSNEEDLRRIRAAARTENGRIQTPVTAQVELVRPRVLKLNLIYPGEKVANNEFSFENVNRFVCTGENGKIIWGGASEGGRSEFGPNSTDSVVMLYLDGQGNLISEESTQVHMSLRLGAIPVGTAKYFAIYRFKRLPESMK
ncbi:hypothetical protein [Cupriavidus sp. WS]|uniref:hypothetical protein n=1 Tax=Cupriavidus sp. WS TaxID=1312922 RepID=UPI0009DBCA07|nr:hypothetical protein [Cupriavidus sp. WS]